MRFFYIPSNQNPLYESCEYAASGCIFTALIINTCDAPQALRIPAKRKPA